MSFTGCVHSKSDCNSISHKIRSIVDVLHMYSKNPPTGSKLLLRYHFKVLYSFLFIIFVFFFFLLQAAVNFPAGTHKYSIYPSVIIESNIQTVIADGVIIVLHLNADFAATNLTLSLLESIVLYT